MIKGYVGMGYFSRVDVEEDKWSNKHAKLNLLAHQQRLDYKNGIPSREIRLSKKKKKKKKDVLGMTLNNIWWWSSSSEHLRSVVYSFIAITPKSTLAQSGSTC